ncbi:MAG: signal peptide peptidase SppA [Bradymonadales bacterium]|nr:signal peptide peptidase SppA [Bradymonadales bacterium]
MSSNSHRIAVFLVVGAVCLCCRSAWAQYGQTPTDGLILPENSITHRDDALALELNPAGLAFIDGWDGQIITTTMEGDLLSGLGAYLGVGLFHRLGLGGSVQWVENPELGGEHKKFTLGFAARAGRAFSAGLAFNYFDSDLDRLVDTFSSWDAGMQLRLGEMFGLAATVRDFNTPTLGGVPLDPRYALGGVFRLDEGRYRLEIEGIYDDGHEDWFFRGRGVVEPLDGLALFAEVGSTSIDNFDLASVRGGLTFSLGHSSVTGAVIAEQEGSFGYAGTTAGVRVVSSPLRTMVRPSGFLAGITLSGSLPERSSRSWLLGGQRSLLDLLLHLEALGRDERVAGVVITLENVALGVGQHWEVRRALQQLREQGKFVAIQLATADFGDVYLASVADWIGIQEGTTFFPRGLSTRLTYLGQLFENIGVQPEFVRIGEYKSSPEALSERAPSEQTLEQINAYYDDLFGHMVSAIAQGRGQSPEQIRELIDSTPLSPQEALERGLVDEVCFTDELEARLSERLGRRTRIARAYDPRSGRDHTWGRRPTVAVVYVDGDIMEGASGRLPVVGRITGHRTLVDLFERLRHNRQVSAIVLRVDSPGGSAWASEEIWRAIDQTDERIPVVVSMGNKAASGGYYVAAGGREIMATDLTLTGSIGIFSGHFSAQGLFQSIGVHRFPILRGANSNLFGMDAPWTEAQRETSRRAIELGYGTFLERVAGARPLSTEEVDSVGRGRIWSGTRAVELGLADEIGGLLDAIARAKELAGLDPEEEVTVLSLPEQGLLAGLPLVGSLASEQLDEEELSDLAVLFQALGLTEAMRFSLLYGDGRPAARLLFDLSEWE